MFIHATSGLNVKKLSLRNTSYVDVVAGGMNQRKTSKL